jgi:hypothetical protein
MVAGVSAHNNLRGHDGLLTKIDAFGEFQWNKTYGTNDNDWIEFGIQTSDGGYLLTGCVQSDSENDEDHSDLWLIKTDSMGSIEWEKKYGENPSEEGWVIQETSDGCYTIAGWLHAYGVKIPYAMLVKINSSGDILWNRTYKEAECVFSIQETSDGGFILTGWTGSHIYGTQDVWILKTDNRGMEEWNTSFGGEERDEGNWVQQTDDGGYIIIGITESNNRYNIWLIKVNETGAKQWDKVFGGLKNDWGLFVHQTSDSGYILSGWTYSYEASDTDLWLIKTNESGVMQWDKTYGDSEDQFAGSAQLALDGGFILTGEESNYTSLDRRILLIKIDNEGNYNCIGSLHSINLLKNQKAYSISRFNYETFIPKGTRINVQFSQNNKTWYNSKGKLNDWDVLKTGKNIIDLSKLNFIGSNFYYRMTFHSENNNLPSLRNIKISYIQEKDNDNDGYFNDWEIYLKTEPNDYYDRPIDSDKDYLPDGDSKNSQNWMDKDDDNDGMPDDWEMKYDLNPLNMSDANKDNDFDAFTNVEEYIAKTDPLDPNDNPENQRNRIGIQSKESYFIYMLFLIIIIIFLIILAIYLKRGKRKD